MAVGCAVKLKRLFRKPDWHPQEVGLQGDLWLCDLCSVDGGGQGCEAAEGCKIRVLVEPIHSHTPLPQNRTASWAPGHDPSLDLQ